MTGINIEKGIAVFFDLQKAFDTIPHYPLLCKVGVDCYLLWWIYNYLSEWKQQMFVNGTIYYTIYTHAGVAINQAVQPLVLDIRVLTTGAHGSILNTTLARSCLSIYNIRQGRQAVL